MHPTHPAASRRRLLALVTSLAFVASLVALPALPADAAPIDTGWSVTSQPDSSADTGVVTNTATTTSDGSVTAASMTYDYDRGVNSGVTEKTWDFTTTATTVGRFDATVKVPYTWQGLHAWAGVTARLDMVVDDEVVDTLYSPAQQWCCTSPSNGFITSGVATFTLSPGQTYGFRLSGSNGDSNSFLRGTFTLSTKPYVESLGNDNRQWTGAVELGDAGDTGKIGESGEARWWKIPVVPGERVSVSVDSLPKDYDLALYGDISAAFERLGSGTTPLDLTKLAAGTSGATPGNQTQVPDYPASVTTVPSSAQDAGVGLSFAPRVYAPRVYAPRVYAPRVYAPRVYAPRVYAPRVYAGDGFAPDLSSTPEFRDAFAAAQSQTLLAVSTESGTDKEIVSASTGNTSGYFYVRVQGHGDKDFDPADSFTVSRTLAGAGDCSGVHGYTRSPDEVPAPSGDDPTTIVVTDSSRFTWPDGDPGAKQAYTDSLQALAGGTDGVVLDVATDRAVQAMQAQAKSLGGCAYAANLVGDAIKDVVDAHRGPSTRYVVIAGGDQVVPFFRYPDTSGFAPEDGFELKDYLGGQPGTSLTANQVLSQDAYGSSTDLTIGGASLPVPDLAVGRLVKTPEEISSTISHFLAAPGGGTVITPDSSLVTGYDFLADAADAVQEQVTAGMGTTDDQRAETLVEPAGTPHKESWTATDLETRLLAKHHDVLFLAGHFNATEALAADFTTAMEADDLARDDGSPVPDPADPSRPVLSDSLVVSPGCHSGYGIVNGAATSDDLRGAADWAQRMAQQHATLVGGTGYQYGDSDFLEYSERLYLGFFKELRTGTAGTPIAAGTALVKAKQDYLATLGQMTGIDQKAVLQATLYGLPMVGVDFAHRDDDGGRVGDRTPTPVADGTPGAALGLTSDDLDVTTGIDGLGDAITKDVPGGPTLQFFEGKDGVTALPGAPVLPKQVVDVSAPGTVLRGVGFRTGTYHQGSGIYPLTGAPAIEGTTPHTTFYSPAWFPQQLSTSNYFDALSNGTDEGRTSLVLSPAQWRSDPGVTPTTDAATTTVRAYSDLGFRLFYNADSTTYGGDGGNQPALAAAPGISDVSGTNEPGSRTVSFSVRATGDPSAGVQAVWVTWTAGPDASGEGRWRSIDLAQDPLDSTRWTGTLTLPDGVDRSAVRFLVQAANGIGAVGLDTAEGNGYQLTNPAADGSSLAVAVVDPRPMASGITATVTDSAESGLEGRAVRMRLFQGTGVGPVVDQVVTTGKGGKVALPWPSGFAPALGTARLVVDLLPVIGQTPVDTYDGTITIQDPAAISLGWDGKPVTRATPGLTASVTDKDLGTAVTGRTVRFTVTTTAGAPVATVDKVVDAHGKALLPAGLPLPAGQDVVVTASIVGSTASWASASRTVTVAKDVLLVVRRQVTADVGTAFGEPGVVLTDARGRLLSGVPVTFSVPTTGPSATFAGGARTATVTTGLLGVALLPRLTAGSTAGVFTMTVSTPRADSRSVTLGARYLMTDFVSPVLGSGTTSARLGSTVPVKIAAMQGTRTRITDALGSSLASLGRVQVQWKPASAPDTAWTAPVGMSYDAKKDLFQRDLKTSTGFGKGTWTVRVRIVDPAIGLDLGSRSFTLKLS